MRKLALLSALSAIALSTPAYARNGAWYVGGDFGGIIVEDTNFDIGVTENALSLDHDFGFDASAFVGYDLGAFRIEAEVAYKHAGVDSMFSTIDIPQGSPGEREFDTAGGGTSALSFMLNGMLDFGDDDGISGFVGAGVGIGKVEYNNVRAFEAADPFIDDSDTQFAWQLIAGLRMPVSQNLDVTLRYRFFNTSGLNLVIQHPGPLDGEPADAKFRSHSILGGITYNFGAPPPPK